ncbi:hypothetical protein D7Z96_17075 [Pseudarthrobacter phenanthrenivorans]|uniref:Lipoprotein n=2 Tax=Pseudarthrobacter phenanthrenivorans TaxID=361575 RepID=A0A3B0F873_PSEPS|nr:hypothetical protein [Pseudarthrobacter phenanthrenivorans]ADX71543.1 hypothetical protein Asphe3_03270 [Pseudarthrobacter phenanthrenivorans Sphe3]RKO21194.1 hypothetical protein D7Z96_17075 [Pseudarthrobacter phenanthrenivorans]
MRRQRLLLALITTAGLASACGPGPGAAPCPAIAQATAVSVTVPADYAPQVAALHLKACQDGSCTEDDVELREGSTSIDQGCDEGVCSATASPNGTKVGQLWLETLTESPMMVTVSGTVADGTALPVRTIEFRPRADYPFGEQCGRFITASVELDADGLHNRS